MKSVGRYLFKVLVDHTSLDAKKTVVGAPKRDGVEAYRLLTRQYHPFSYDVASQMLENILIMGRGLRRTLSSLTKCSRSCGSGCTSTRQGLDRSETSRQLPCLA